MLEVSIRRAEWDGKNAVGLTRPDRGEPTVFPMLGRGRGGHAYDARRGDPPHTGDRPVTSPRRQPDPGEEDTFSSRGMTLSFERDRNDQVIGFYLSNTRTRDVRFERMR